ncbi:MAG: RagB/SusD family nutrient uptake outer membrane protein [Bacteroidia bacterium]|nr:RagB/SusD family nutrient uptake outer membrane protein [Bacteroidia bacterium]
MKSKNTKTGVKYVIIVLLFVLSSCENQLKEIPYSQFSPDNFLITESGLNDVLVSAYGNMHLHAFNQNIITYMEEACTDIMLQSGGGQELSASKIIGFVWDSQHSDIAKIFKLLYVPIRDVNIFLDNTTNVNFISTNKETRIAEAKAIRAYCFYMLNKFYGEVPLITSSHAELYPAKTEEVQIHSFIESELLAASEDLPVIQDQYARITKGGALSILCDFYLNTKQWQKCINTATKIIDLKVYSLYPDYETLFAPTNDINSEYIFVFPNLRIAEGGMQWLGQTFPPNYPKLPNQNNFASQWRLYDAFVNSFDKVADKRFKLILTSYTDTKNVFIKLLGKDNARSFKFKDDLSFGPNQGNDQPIFRYADILLSEAEALNELNGPNQISIDLINLIRNRAGLANLNLVDFTTKELLRDHLLKERGWEFYYEGVRRSDLIRHGKFISQAKARGVVSADDYRVRYPIPQGEIDSNPNIVQNPGY